MLPQAANYITKDKQ